MYPIWLNNVKVVVYSLNVVRRKCTSIEDTCVLLVCMYWSISWVYGFQLHMLRLPICPHIGYVRTPTLPIFTPHTHRWWTSLMMRRASS